MSGRASSGEGGGEDGPSLQVRVFACVCVCVCVCVYVCMYAYTYMYIYVYIHVCICTHMCTYIYASGCMWALKSTFTNVTHSIHTTHTRVDACTPSCIHTRTGSGRSTEGAAT